MLMRLHGHFSGKYNKLEIVSCRQQSEQCPHDRRIQLENQITFLIPTARWHLPQQLVFDGRNILTKLFNCTKLY